MLHNRIKISFIVLVLSSLFILNTYTVHAVDNSVTVNDEYGLLDAMKDQAKYNSKVDIEVMNQASSFTSRVFGTITSCIVYGIFALSAVTTACDLLYIAAPPIRSFLYNPGDKQNNTTTQMYGNNNNNTVQKDISTQSGNIFEKIKNGEGALISSDLIQLLNAPTSTTNAYMNRIPVSIGMYGRQGYGRQGYGRQGYGRRSYNNYMGNNFGLNEQMQVPEIKMVILEYFKNRTIALVVMAIVMVLLLSSSIFTDCGLNIGEAVMRWLGF